MISKIGNLKDYVVIITGANGFIGRSLVKKLLECSTSVIALDLDNNFVGPVEANYQNNFSYLSGALTENLDTALEVKKSKRKLKSALFHLSGMSSVDQCKSQPDKAYEVNTFQTLFVLDRCKNNNVGKFIFPSTGQVYGDQLFEPANERQQLSPASIYASTKLAAEIIIQSYIKNYAMDCIILRMANVYGPNSNTKSIIGTLIQHIKKKEIIQIHDNTPVRDFIYIDDIIDGLICALQLEKSEESIFNLSSGACISIDYLVNTILEMTSYDRNMLSITHPSEKCTSSIILNHDLFSKTTDWRPKYSLNEGLKSILKIIAQ